LVTQHLNGHPPQRQQSATKLLQQKAQEETEIGQRLSVSTSFLNREQPRKRLHLQIRATQVCQKQELSQETAMMTP